MGSASFPDGACEVILLSGSVTNGTADPGAGSPRFVATAVLQRSSGDFAVVLVAGSLPAADDEPLPEGSTELDMAVTTICSLSDSRVPKSIVLAPAGCHCAVLFADGGASIIQLPQFPPAIQSHSQAEVAQGRGDLTHAEAAPDQSGESHVVTISAHPTGASQVSTFFHWRAFKAVQKGYFPEQPQPVRSALYIYSDSLQLMQQLVHPGRGASALGSSETPAAEQALCFPSPVKCSAASSDGASLAVCMESGCTLLIDTYSLLVLSISPCLPSPFVCACFLSNTDGSGGSRVLGHTAAGLAAVWSTSSNTVQLCAAKCERPVAGMVSVAYDHGTVAAAVVASCADGGLVLLEPSSGRFLAQLQLPQTMRCGPSGVCS